MNTVSLLLDTDIGSDIDDAVALAYLLKQPHCELLGITTVSGEPEKRAMLADAIVRASGRDNVPIHVGADKPLIVPQHQPHAPQAEALQDSAARAFENRSTAVDFLRRTIREHPGEITLLPIGPLTNIALLFALDPEIPGLLKQVVLMGGWFFDRPRPEWNILCDPHAAAMVFAAPVPRLTAVGIDVTKQCTLEANECRTRFTKAGGPLGTVAAMAEVWFRHASHITFHDPLAAALVFDPSLCRLEEHQVAVDLTSPLSLGQTVVVDGKDPRSAAHLASSVDRDKFFSHYFDVVGG